MNVQKSDYFKKLMLEHPDAARRYEFKVKAIGGMDPYYIATSSLSFHSRDFPTVTNMDIVSYLVLTTSFYTKQQMKAYKSLAAYKYFEAGFVTECGVAKIKDYCVVIGKVRHSQRMNDPPLNVWIISDENGGIEAAHCTCMAGLGEVCSHVGALLYACEFINTSKSTTSCTDVRCLWNVPTITEVRSEELKNIKFGRTIFSSDIEVPSVSAVEVVDILTKIEESGSSSVLMRVTEPFASSMTSSNAVPPNTFKSVYNEEYESLYREQLVQLVEQHVQVNITDEDCRKIEEGTRNQEKNKEWFEQRAGRITASKLKQVCRTSLTKPSLSLIKQICYPLQFKFKTKATEWGITHETIALQRYEADMRAVHENVEIKTTGLIICSDLPQFGASPDALVTCTCCGDGCVEIKCPYILKDSTIEQYAKSKSTCLIVHENGDIHLDTEHAYYYQIQQQMALTKTLHCDFIVWSPTEMFCERVGFNEDFWWCHMQDALAFHRQVVMPELLGRLYTRNIPSVSTWCTCQEPDDGTPMICCDNEVCNIKWYHLQCLGLSDVPEGIWLCQYCA